MCGVYELYANEEDANNFDNRLAEVVVFESDTTVINWDGKIKSTVIHESMENFAAISLTGKRVLLYYDTHAIGQWQIVKHRDGIFCYVDKK